MSRKPLFAPLNGACHVKSNRCQSLGRSFGWHCRDVATAAQARADGFVLLTLLALFVVSPPVASADDLPAAPQVKLVVGHWLSGERSGGAVQRSQAVAKDSVELDFPFGVDFDSRDRMYVVEMSGNRVFRLESDGSLTRIAGTGTAGYSGDGGPATEATFREMHNLAIGADDNLYVADSANHTVRHIDMKTGIITTLAGNGEKGFDGDAGRAADARFRKTISISFGPKKRRLYVADIYNVRIRAIDVAAGTVKTIAGNGKSGVPSDGDVAAAGPLVDPRAVSTGPDGGVYVLERAGHALRVVDPDGKIRTIAGSGKKGYRDGAALEAQFDGPKHLCVDDAGNVYIADDVNNAIRKYDPKWQTVTTVLGRGHGDARVKLSKPHGVCFHNGKLYVVDSGNNRVLSVSGLSK